jgi:hypothetical protein
MTYRELLPVGRSGGRLRKAFVAGALLAITYAAWHLVRDPAWDGWWDAFNWAQLFLYAPVLFFFGAATWQLLCLVAENLYQQRKSKVGNLSAGAAREEQRTLRFWLRDSLRICLLYFTACVIGDIPMAVNYIAAVRGWHLHWWWSNVVAVCLLVMVAVWWTLDRIYERRF